MVFSHMLCFADLVHEHNLLCLLRTFFVGSHSIKLEAYFCTGGTHVQ